MTISVLLRLAPEALDDGRLAGSVELVETGARAVVRDAGELVTFLRQAGFPVATAVDADPETSPGQILEGGSR